MFGKRKHSEDDSKQRSAGGEPRHDEVVKGSEPSRKPEQDASAGSERRSSPQDRSPEEVQRPRGPSRPDANAVLGRHASPPVMPDKPRRAVDLGLQRRAQERRQDGGEEGKRLIVGRNISLSGEINTCDKLVVEGEVNAELTDSRSLEITETGLFKGKAVIDEADVAGKFEGEMTVRGKLYVRAKGRLSGHVRYGDLQVELGGRMSGTVEELEEQKEADKPAEAPAAKESTSDPQKTASQSQATAREQTPVANGTHGAQAANGANGANAASEAKEQNEPAVKEEPEASAQTNGRPEDKTKEGGDAKVGENASAPNGKAESAEVSLATKDSGSDEDKDGQKRSAVSG